MPSSLRSIFNKFPSALRKGMFRLLWNKRYRRYADLRTGSRGGYSLVESDKMNCLYIHIPKTGGTAINQALFGTAGAGHNSYDSMQLIYSKRELDSMFSFAFVRNPWSRLYSSYRYLKKGGGNDWDKDWAEKHLAQYPDFKSFVLGWVSPESVYSFLHFVPQSHYLLDNRGELVLDYIGRFENFSQDFEFVRMQLAAQGTLKRMNVSTSPDEYLHFYDEEMTEIVAKAYAKDIDLLGYSFS